MEATKFKEQLQQNPAFMKMTDLGVNFHFSERTRDYYNKGYYTQQEGELEKKRGNSLKAQECFRKAIEHYKNAIVLTPDHFKSYNNLGNCYNELGLFSECLAAHEKAVQCNPDDVISWESLGVSQKDQGKNEDALKSWKKALSLCRPSDRMYLLLSFRLANLLTVLEHYEEALSFYDDLLKHVDRIGDPENVLSEREAVLSKIAERKRLSEEKVTSSGEKKENDGMEVVSIKKGESLETSAITSGFSPIPMTSSNSSNSLSSNLT